MQTVDRPRATNPRTRRRLRILLALGATGVVIVLVWFQPQTLLFDVVVDEALPTTPAHEDAPSADAPAPEGAVTEEEPAAEPSAEPVVLGVGTFESRHRYTVEGQAIVLELPDGTRVLRLEGFESTNGPDLFVYLTAADSADDDAALNEDVVNLGVLRGNIGNQNYEIPPDVDLTHHDTAVIWCRRFTRGFGAADLAPAP